jgi:hypothetical protein
MADKIDRDALSKLVVYPQNAHFVKTGEGDLFPIDHIKKQLQDRVQQHSPQITNGFSFIAVLLIQITLPLCGGIACLSLALSDSSSPSRKLPIELAMNRVCVGGLGLLLLLLALVVFVELYGRYALDRDPEAEFLRRLKNSPIAVAKVESVSRLSNHDVELVFRFELMQNNGENGTSQLNRYKAKSRVSPSKIYEPGDEILVLYYDNSLLTVL